MELQATATIGEVIGWNIRERRTARWTQPQFGQLIGTVLPKPWPAQTVSSAEKGERAFAAAELVAIAQLLEVSVAALFSPPLPVQRVTVTEQLIVPAQTLHASALPLPHHDDVSTVLYAEAWSTLGRIAKLRQNIVEQTELIEEESRSLFIRLEEIKGEMADQHAPHHPHITTSTETGVVAGEAAPAAADAQALEEESPSLFIRLEEIRGEMADQHARHHPHTTTSTETGVVAGEAAPAAADAQALEEDQHASN